MKEHLKRLLTPGDDGSAFVAAVLFKASGALHRRRVAAEEAAPAWQWLAAWARPWVVAVLLTVAVFSLLPVNRWRGRAAPVAVMPADSDIMAASLLPADIAVATATVVVQER